jgi:signal transduction histidine kinase
LYYKQGKFEQAYAMQAKYHAAKEEIFTEEARNAEMLLNIKLETQRLKNEAELAKSEKEKADILIEKQRQELAAANELEQVNKELKRLNREKTELMGITAHDMKNPIAAILFSVEIGLDLLERQKYDRLESQFERIYRTARRQSVIITQLLDDNALETGNFTIMMQDCHLIATARSSMKAYLHAAEQKSITITESFTMIENDTISADPSVLRQIMDNYLSNALKFSEEGSSIEIGVCSAGDALRYYVKDSGQGLSEQDKTKLFKKFARLSAQPTAGESSTGLGLSIAKRFAEAMNGKVGCDSEQGKGATFWCEFPKV